MLSNSQNKKAVVLHGYRASPYVNWYPWLSWKLRKAGYKTWSPWLPLSSMPDGRRWNAKLLSNKKWSFKGNLVVGHSAGAVQVLNLLQHLPKDQKVGRAVLVSAFRPKSNWVALSRLIPEPFDFDKIKSQADQIIFVHGADDSLCPVADAEYYARKLGAELIILPKGGHFSILRNIKFWRFPRLLEIIIFPR